MVFPGDNLGTPRIEGAGSPGQRSADELAMRTNQLLEAAKIFFHPHNGYLRRFQRTVVVMPLGRTASSMVSQHLCYCQKRTQYAVSHLGVFLYSPQPTRSQ